MKGVRGRIMMYTGFSIFSILFSVVSLFIVGCVIAVFVSVLRERHKNRQSPRLTVEAKIVSRRESHSSSMNQTTHMMDTFTTYYATFEVASGDRMELRIPRADYGMLAEGDFGDLTFQGTQFLEFRRKY